MSQHKKELLIATPIAAFVVGGFFIRHLPVIAQDVWFIILLLIGCMMIVASWACWSIARNDRDVARWRKAVGLFGVMANTLAALIPFLVLPMLAGQITIQACLVCSFCGMAAGILAPREIRLPTTLSGLIVASAILAVRIGV
jgi:hypothetical protein